MVFAVVGIEIVASALKGIVVKFGRTVVAVVVVVVAVVGVIAVVAVVGGIGVAEYAEGVVELGLRFERGCGDSRSFGNEILDPWEERW